MYCQYSCFLFFQFLITSLATFADMPRAGSGPGVVLNYAHQQLCSVIILFLKSCCLKKPKEVICAACLLLLEIESTEFGSVIVEVKCFKFHSFCEL
jgi:hypothetical protein